MNKYLIIASIIIYFILLIILVINFKRKNPVIKYSFIILMTGVLLIFLGNNMSNLDSLLTCFLEYIYYPSYNTYFLTIILTILIFIYTIFNEKINSKIRIVNYIFSILMILSFIIFSSLNVDKQLYSSLYVGNSLKCLRYVSRSFCLWIGLVSIIKMYQNIINKRWL